MKTQAERYQELYARLNIITDKAVNNIFELYQLA